MHVPVSLAFPYVIPSRPQTWVVAQFGASERRRAKLLWQWLYREDHWAASVDEMTGQMQCITTNPTHCFCTSERHWLYRVGLLGF